MRILCVDKNIILSYNNLMQQKEAIEDLMDAIQAQEPHRMCSLCVNLYGDIPGTKRVCWFNEAANKANFDIALYELTSSSGRKNAENCVNPNIVKMVLEIQSLAAGSDGEEV